MGSQKTRAELRGGGELVSGAMEFEAKENDRIAQTELMRAMGKQLVAPSGRVKKAS